MDAGAVFLDRDGVIIENRDDYVKDWSDVEFLPGALRAMAILRQAHYPTLLVTNQSAVGRGILSSTQAVTINRKIVLEIEKQGGQIDGWFMCPHAPDDGCRCRKPQAGMLQDAAIQFQLDMTRSWMIGDALSDMEAARKVGARPILVQTGRGLKQSAGATADVTVVPDLAAAVHIVIENDGERLSRVLVTGAAGYIGSVVAEQLIEAGHEVVAFDNLSHGHRWAIHPKARFVEGDLGNFDDLVLLMRESRFDSVVHLAAEALIEESVRDPGRFYRANVSCGLNLLDAMADTGVKAMVFSSTAAVYGEPAHVPIAEDATCQPVNSYGASKLAFEQAMEWYRRAHAINYVTLRYFNAAGASERFGELHEPETHLIAILFEVALGLRDSVQLFGTDYDTPDGTCIRDYIHVSDIAQAHLLALQQVDSLDDRLFNMGNGEGYSNRQVIENVKCLTGKEIPVVEAPRRTGDPEPSGCQLKSNSRSAELDASLPGAAGYRFVSVEVAMSRSRWGSAVIVSRTPLRVSFAGGGSDLASFYERHAGAVVSTAINKHIYITVNMKFDEKIRASYSVTEIVDSVDDVRNELVREALKLVGICSGIEITSISDIPSEGTGLGSSSTYLVGLLNALYAYCGRHAGAERLAREACSIEIDRCGKPIGKQDQYIAAYGGLQYIQFKQDGSVYVDPIICTSETKRKLQEQLFMLYTGVTRSANQVLKEQQENTEKDAQNRRALRAMTRLAQDMRESLSRDDVTTFGEILNEGWELKKELASQISNSDIDDWYEIARSHGATGGKILGAGGGGFLLVCAPPERHAAIIRPAGLNHTVSRFEPQGSKIIYVEEGD